MTAILVIAVGFTVWACVHSLLASRWMKSWVRRILGPSTDRWYRAFFVSFAVLTAAPILLALALLADRSLYTVPSPWRWLMATGQIGALIALGLSVLQAGLLHFIGLAQVLAQDPGATGHLQVRGIYRYVRHPLYLFSILLIWLTPVMTRNLATLYACMTIYFVVGSYHEEALLVDEFGESYEAYRRQVPRFLPVPGRRYREGSTS